MRNATRVGAEIGRRGTRKINPETTSAIAVSDRIYQGRRQEFGSGGGGTLGRRFSLISPSKYFWKILQSFSQIL